MIDRRLRTLAASVLLLSATRGVDAAVPVAATVHIRNFAFVPARLTVRAGTAVSFINDDEEPHTATSVEKHFDSEAIDTHGRWTHTFSTPGTFAYFCELHPTMKGRLIVASGNAR